MSLSNYDFNFESWISDQLHPDRRRPKRIALMKAYAAWLRKLHSEAIDYFKETRDRIKWNGQTIKLENLLIARYGSGIYIISNIGDSIDGLTLGRGIDISGGWGRGSDISSYLGRTYTAAITSFTVYVPASIVFIQSEMQALIKTYNNNTFNIVII